MDSRAVGEIIIKSSTWIVSGHGDVVQEGARYPGGKKMLPRKKRGKPLSAALKREMAIAVEAARERRRCGVEVSRRAK